MLFPSAYYLAKDKMSIFHFSPLDYESDHICLLVKSHTLELSSVDSIMLRF